MQKLSLAQQAYLEAILYYGKDYPTNSGGILYLPGNIKHEDLEFAVRKCVNHICELHTKFVEVDNKIYAVIKDVPYQYQIDYLDFADNWDQEKLDRYTKKSINHFDDHLFRVAIATSNQKCAIVFVVHHLICDGVSIKQLSNNLIAILSGKMLTENQPYQIYLDLEEKYLASKQFLIDKEFWKNELRLNGSSKIKPHLLIKELDQVIDGHYCFLKQQSEAISKFLLENSISAQILFEAILALLVSYANGSDLITLGITTHNRRKSQLNIFGLMTATLPININVSRNQTFRELLNHIKLQRIKIYRHQMFPYQEILKIYRKYQVKNSFTAMINYQVDTNYVDGLKYDEDIVLPDTNELSVILNVNKNVSDGSYKLSGTFKKSVFNDSDGVKRYLDLFVAILNKAISNRDIKLCQLLNIDNNQFREVVIKDGILDRFLLQVLNNKDRVAVCDNNKSLTYRQLDSYSNKIAIKLVNLNLNNKIIRINLTSKVDSVAAILAIIKSNNTYCFFPEDSGHLESQYQKICQVDYQIDDQFLVDLNLDFQTLIPRVNQILALYLTSGTTKIAKAVRIKDVSLFNYILQQQGFQGQMGNINTLLNLAQFHFDISLENIFLSLLNGKTLYLADIKQPILIKEPIDFISTTPSLIQVLLKNDQFISILKELKTLVLGGEVLSLSLYQKLKESTKAQIYNSYGPTETTIAVTSNLVNENDIAIGYPYLGCEITIRNKKFEILPNGFAGEIIVGGICLADGYQNSSDGGFISCQDKSYYMTGDYGYFDNDGKLNFLGRLDNQVKKNGIRIELDQIDRVLLECCDVIQSKTSLVDNMIITNITSSAGDVTTFKKHLKLHLPVSHIPNQINIFNEVSLNESGKAKYDVTHLSVKQEFIAKTSQEQIFVDCLKEVFNVDKIYLTDTFFDLGGDSLLALTLLYCLADKGIKINYAKIYQIENVVDLIKEHKEQLVVKGQNYQFYQTKKINGNFDNILLLGSTGFLGCHLLRELLVSTTSNITVYLRNKDNCAKQRLIDRYRYYFNSELKFDRITIMTNDLSEHDCYQMIDCIVNSAAKVDFIGRFDDFYQSNVLLVQKLIDLAKEKNIPIFHVSTIALTFSENELFDEVSNFKETNYLNYYLYTKRLAEDLLMNSSLPIYLLRVGNLMPRSYDNKFQVNPENNAIYQLVKQNKITQINDENVFFDYSAVDIIASAIVKIVMSPPSLRVLHILNNKLNRLSLSKEFNLKTKRVLNDKTNQILEQLGCGFKEVKVSQVKKTIKSWKK